MAHGLVGRAVPLVVLLAPGLAPVAPDSGAPGPQRLRVDVQEVELVHAGARLAGSLLLPEAPGRRPALVLLGGSDRGPRSPVKERLARHLAECGVAVLVYDSPGTGASGGSALLQTRADRAREALAAARFLRAQDGIDPRRVGLLGASEGARVALMAAGMEERIAFAVLLSGGFGLSTMELARYRIETMGLRRGLAEDEIRRALLLEELLFALFAGPDAVELRLLTGWAERFPGEPWGELVRIVSRSREVRAGAEQEELWDRLRAILRGWLEEPWFGIAVTDRANLERVLAMDAATFFAFLERAPLAQDADSHCDERALAAGVRCPVLAVWGEEDDFLPPHTSRAWLQAVLADAGNTDVTLAVLPALGHSLVPAEGDAPLALFATWLTAHVVVPEREEPR